MNPFATSARSQARAQRPLAWQRAIVCIVLLLIVGGTLNALWLSLG